MTISAPIGKVINQSGTDGTTSTTAAFTPTANQPILLFAFARGSTGAELSSVTGQNLTWTKLFEFAGGVGVSIWHGVGAAPTNEGITMTWASTRTWRGWAATEIPGGHLDPASFFGQTAQTNSVAGTSVSANLPNAFKPDSIAFGALFADVGGSMTSGDGFVIAQTSSGGERVGGSEYKSAADNDVDFSFSVSTTLRVVAMEIAAAPERRKFRIPTLQAVKRGAYV